MEREDSRDVISRKAMIRFKLLMNYYHYGQNAKSADIVKEMGVAKSEVSAGIAQLVTQGYLQETERKKKTLTELGCELAYKTHQKYEIAYQKLCAIFEDKQEAAECAEILVITMKDRFFDAPALLENRSPLTRQVCNLVEFSGKKLCEAAKPGIYLVHVNFLTFPDTDAVGSMDSLSPGEMGHPGNLGETASSVPDLYSFQQRHSMANGAFVQPAFVHFSDGKGFLKLHRQVIRRKNRDQEMMEGKAQEILCHDGKTFVKYEFVGDDVAIPIEHFYFNLLHDEFHGTAIMKFSCTVGKVYMPLSVAKIDIVL